MHLILAPKRVDTIPLLLEPNLRILANQSNMKFTAIILAASLAVSGAFVQHAPATARAGRFAVKAHAEKEPAAGLPQFDAKLAPATVATALSMVPMAAHAEDYTAAAGYAGIGLVATVVGFAVGFATGFGAQVANVGK